MTFRDVVLAALVEHFSDQDLRVGTPGQTHGPASAISSRGFRQGTPRWARPA